MLFRPPSIRLGVSAVARHVVKAVVVLVLAFILRPSRAAIGSIPDVHAVLGAANRHLCHRLPSDLQVGRGSSEDWAAVACHCRLPVLGGRGFFPLGPAEVVEMLKVPLGNRSFVGAAEYANLKVLDQTVGGSFSAGFLKSVEVLVDDLVGVDVLRDVLPRLFVRNEFLWASEINAVLDLISKKMAECK